MAIQDWFDKTIVVYRPKTVSGYKKNTVSTGTVDVHIQRIEDQDTLDAYGVQGVLYKGWVDVSEDVREGDVVQDNLGNRYSVIGVNKLESAFTVNDHLELIMKEYHARVVN